MSEIMPRVCVSVVLLCGGGRFRLCWASKHLLTQYQSIAVTLCCSQGLLKKQVCRPFTLPLQLRVKNWLFDSCCLTNNTSAFSSAFSHSEKHHATLAGSTKHVVTVRRNQTWVQDSANRTQTRVESGRSLCSAAPLDLIDKRLPYLSIHLSISAHYCGEVFHLKNDQGPHTNIVIGCGFCVVSVLWTTLPLWWMLLSRCSL